ncbi:M12 family metallo-peptidase [Yeosuana sp. MJ-SS3]|uniref:M12 family metallo-peptidase n=1 Tax=Gilvirhabdus luticola TaxID=3079858 RepID=A0ABU3U9N1_9FLAO|nr:zinc-dependent metalloprotease family protein [Yeosuana sp. MJ-SS3]MDU8886785.1 M12 family metallo-peptidase [Yeosuana sp. MJ-SS3]
MKNYYSKLQLILVVVLFSILQSNAQKNNSVWTKITKEKIGTTEKVLRKSEPKKAIFFQLNIEALKTQLLNAPLRGDSPKVSNLVIEFPNKDGKMESFRVKEAPVMVPEMQANHPDLRSYVGQSIQNPSKLIRFSVTPLGLHTMTLSSGQGTQYMDPYTKDGLSYISYLKKDLSPLKEKFICHFEENKEVSSKTQESYNKVMNANDGMMRTFRLALACTGEYGTYHGGSVPSVKAAMAVTMTRVNGIYERDLSLTMSMVENASIIYLDGATDPYTNNNESTMLGENQTEIDTKIGTANYDIGHVFGTGGGGVAILQSPCRASVKAQGVTGLPNPVGDVFDIEYVCHEMGHQYGAPHTFNSTAGFCGSGGQRVDDNAYEPGSGSTIMAYAGICSPENVQNNSDAYFHQKSLQMIWDNITTGLSQCASQMDTNNDNPPVADAGNNYTIPISTPYKLTGDSSDADGALAENAHTYTWEQYDLSNPADGSKLPTETTATGPIVRSFEGTTNPIRYIPRITDILSNGSVSTTWEKLVSINRDINFQLTVRDNDADGGQTDSDGMTVTTNNAGGPFLVTSQSTYISYPSGSSQTIEWDVAGTDIAPFNVSNVNIWLSTDGGLTYDTPLAMNTPNDGSQNVTLPNIQEGFCRVMVEAVGNIFFNINTEDFSIGGTISNVCTEFASTDPNLPISIPDNGGAYDVQTGILVGQSGTITDVNVSIDITHTWVGDLDVAVQSPDFTFLQLMDPFNPCQQQDDLIVTFDDDGVAFDCNLTGSDISMQSTHASLSDWNGEEVSGSWIIGVGDFGTGDTGTLNGWSVTICYDAFIPLSIDDFNLANFSIYPNPNNGEFTISLKSFSDNDIKVAVYDMRGRKLFTNDYKNSSNFSQIMNLNHLQSGMYLVHVSDGERNGSKKIIIN